MTAATLTAKRQITVPKNVRQAMDLDTGDRVAFVMARDGCFSLVPVKSSIQSLKGCIPKPPKAVAIEDMNAAIRRRAVVKFGAKR